MKSLVLEALRKSRNIWNGLRKDGEKIKEMGSIVTVTHRDLIFLYSTNVKKIQIVPPPFLSFLFTAKSHSQDY